MGGVRAEWSQGSLIVLDLEFFRFIWLWNRMEVCWTNGSLLDDPEETLFSASCWWGGF